jgi:hypothetical protein
MTTFADLLFDYQTALDEFEGNLLEVWGEQWDGLHGDRYDNSLELHNVESDARLDLAAQQVIFDAGFTKIYLNHKDRWETHYHWDREVGWFSPQSRVQYPHKVPA